MTAALVYQAGSANVFTRKGRAWVRVYQGDFRGAEMFARGLACAGVRVRSYHCNMAGDIINGPWSRDLDDAPFRESMCPVNAN